MCITSAPQSQILVRFARQPAVFKLQATLRQVHGMTDPKMTWNPTRSHVPHVYVLLGPRVPKYNPFCSMTSHFWSYRPF